MHFLPDVYVQCESCKGKRYNRETLEVLYKNKSIADVLNMTVDEALLFFDKIGAIKSRLSVLFRWSSGYIHLDSPQYLSGVKLIKTCIRAFQKSNRQDSYILDDRQQASFRGIPDFMM
jgi:excinuclease ABC subunit A